MIVNVGAILYRAGQTAERYPTPRLCSDTGKRGVYFSLNSPYLSETMCIEYNRPLKICIYRVIQDIVDISPEKYAFRYDENTGEMKDIYYEAMIDHHPINALLEDNVSHFDNRIDAISSSIQKAPPDCAELFLVGHDLNCIQYVGEYDMTVAEAIRKWQK
jgi:hypothetical protein